MRTLSPDQFQARLFEILGKKHHWATPHFNGNNTTKNHLCIHYHQDYVVYLRDFSVLLARIIGKNPPWDIRRSLAKTIYEEETGGLSLGSPHQEQFLKMMSGLGFDRAGFRDVELIPSGRMYREWLDNICQKDDWLIGTIVLIIFVEGTVHDREDVLSPRPSKTQAEIEDLVMKHPLVQCHGLSPQCMDFIRIQYMVKPENRKETYKMILRHVNDGKEQQEILDRLEEVLRLWIRYQDGLARACGLRQA